MIGRPERFGVSMSSRVERGEHARGERVKRRAQASPRRSLTSKPASTVASDATGEGPEYRYGGAATFSSCLTSVGQAMNASSDEYALEKPPTSTMPVVGLAGVADDAVAAQPIRRRFVVLSVRR